MSKSEEIKASGIFDFPVFPVPGAVLPTFSGMGEKGLLVVLGENASPELKGFLEKVLGAVGLDLSKDALMLEVPSEDKIAFAKIAEERSVHHAIFFGIKADQALLNINAPNYHPFKLGGVSFLFADQLSAIQADAKLKRPLWESLKGMFSS